MILIIITRRKVKEKINGMDVAQMIKNKGGKMIWTICIFLLSVLTDSMAEEFVLAISVAEKREVIGWVIVKT